MPEFPSSSSSYGSINAVLPLLEYLENKGFELAEILDEVGIPRSALGNAKMRCPKRKLQALWAVASEVTDDPAIALRVSTTAKTNALGIIGYLAAASESVRNSLELVKDLTPLLLEDVECELKSDGEVAFFRCNTGSGPEENHFTGEYAIGLTITMSRLIGAAHTDPIEARFSYPAPAYADEYERILRLPIRFDAEEDGVLFPTSMMDGLNPSADAALRKLLEQHASDQLARLPLGTRFSERVRACILSRLPLGNLTAWLLPFLNKLAVVMIATSSVLALV